MLGGAVLLDKAGIVRAIESVKSTNFAAGDRPTLYAMTALELALRI